MSQTITLVVPEAPAPESSALIAQRGVKKTGLRLGVLDNSKGNADHLLKMVVGGMRAEVAAGGYSKAEAKRLLWEHAWMPLGRFSEENFERRMRVQFPARLRDAGPDPQVPVAQKPEDFVFVVVGGAGKHSAFIPTFGVTRSVTRALCHRDGRLVGSISELKQP